MTESDDEVAAPETKEPAAKLPRVVDPEAKMLAAFKYAETLKLVVVAPEFVSIEKIDDVAAFNTWKARPFVGEVWRVVVAWP